MFCFDLIVFPMVTMVVHVFFFQHRSPFRISLQSMLRETQTVICDDVVYWNPWILEHTRRSMIVGVWFLLLFRGLLDDIWYWLWYGDLLNHWDLWISGSTNRRGSSLLWIRRVWYPTSGVYRGNRSARHGAKKIKLDSNRALHMYFNQFSS